MFTSLSTNLSGKSNSSRNPKNPSTIPSTNANHPTVLTLSTAVPTSHSTTHHSLSQPLTSNNDIDNISNRRFMSTTTTTIDLNPHETLPTSPVSPSSPAHELNRDKYVGAIDQGTTSSRFILFDRRGGLVASHQVKLLNTFPKPGWQEQDPLEILATVRACISGVMSQGFTINDIASIGITNQRETLVVWDKFTGLPLHRAIVWSDLRTDDLCHTLELETGSKDSLRPTCGLPISTYFTGLKLRWLIENSTEVADAIKNERAMAGTVDSWLIWSLTGGVNSGVHVTDVSNASRTMLMSLETLTWDDDLCARLKVDKALLPKISSNSEIYGHIADPILAGIPISGCVGDQQAALLGQLCLESGHAKNTYGTGCFLLANTGTSPVQSKHGLLTTVAFKLGPDEPCQYALEGSVAVAGAAVSWLQESMGMISSPEEFSELASSVPDAGGMYFVPAFSGLLSPHWRDDARGTMVGLTRYITKAHFCRAALEAAAYQTNDVVEAMNRDAGYKITSLKVDGGLSRSTSLCQFQSDILNIPVLRPIMDERTALGAAFAAGLAKGVEVWKNVQDLQYATMRFECLNGATNYNSDNDDDNEDKKDSNEENNSSSTHKRKSKSELYKDEEKGATQNNITSIPTTTIDTLNSAINTTSTATTPGAVDGLDINELVIGDDYTVDEADQLVSTPRKLSRKLSFEEQFKKFTPSEDFNRDERLRGWHKAIERSLNWVE